MYSFKFPEIHKLFFKQEHEIFISEVSFEDHSRELYQRILQVFGIIFVLTVLIFLNINSIIELFLLGTNNIKFFQLSPDEYFLVTIKISFYLGLTGGSPLLLYQLICFLFPGLNKKEGKIIIYFFCSIFLLFSFGLIFAYFILIPTSLGFFLNYSKDIIEPLLGFDQYIEFIAIIFFITGLLFQLPILQTLLVVFDIVKIEKMKKIWKPIIIFSTIISAVFTPSADPFTQLVLASILLILYFVGIVVANFVKTNFLAI